MDRYALFTFSLGWSWRATPFWLFSHFSFSGLIPAHLNFRLFPCTVMTDRLSWSLLQWEAEGGITVFPMMSNITVNFSDSLCRFPKLLAQIWNYQNYRLYPVWLVRLPLNRDLLSPVQVIHQLQRYTNTIQDNLIVSNRIDRSIHKLSHGSTDTRCSWLFCNSILHVWLMGDVALFMLWLMVYRLCTK